MNAPVPEVLAGVRAGQQSGDLEVVRAGVRGGHCPGNPRGWPAAECRCLKCGRVVVIPLYRLLNGNTKSCGRGACFRPRKSGIRDAIVTRVADTGGAWMGQIRDHSGLSDGAAGGHLHYLVKAGRLERPVRGFYHAPGPVPPWPSPAS